jgi:hypothetical protein
MPVSVSKRRSVTDRLFGTTGATRTLNRLIRIQVRFQLRHGRTTYSTRRLVAKKPSGEGLGVIYGVDRLLHAQAVLVGNDDRR